MTQKTLQNGHATISDVRQQFLLEMDDVVSNIENGEEATKRKKPRSRRRPTRNSSDIESFAVAQLLREELRQIETRFVCLETLVREIREKTIHGSLIKDYYTTREVARIVDRSPYTVREWCRLGRVRGEKAFSGRGIDEEWRISHAELVRIQNEGLLHPKCVPMPCRLETRKAAGESA